MVLILYLMSLYYNKEQYFEFPNINCILRDLLGSEGKKLFCENVLKSLYGILFLYKFSNTSFHDEKMKRIFLLKIVEFLSLCLQSERCIIYLNNSGNNKLTTLISYGCKESSFSCNKDRGFITLGAIGLSFTTGVPIHICSPFTDPRFDNTIDYLRRSITQRMLIVPIKINEISIGCVGILNRSCE